MVKVLLKVLARPAGRHHGSITRGKIWQLFPKVTFPRPQRAAGVQSEKMLQPHYHGCKN